VSLFNFPVGYHDLHKTKIIDFQLNRWYSLGYARLRDIQEAAANIKNLGDWKQELVRLADNALSEGRGINAAFYYRAAEFFTHPADPDKQALYDKFTDLFYNQLFANEPFERHKVPYGNAYLPALKVSMQAEAKLGTIVIHGGFDSFIEEFYSMALYFSDLGYEIIMFDVGQARAGHSNSSDFLSTTPGRNRPRRY
jgi:hypothetical protein